MLTFICLAIFEGSANVMVTFPAVSRLFARVYVVVRIASHPGPFNSEYRDMLYAEYWKDASWHGRLYHYG